MIFKTTALGCMLLWPDPPPPTEIPVLAALLVAVLLAKVIPVTALAVLFAGC